MANEENVSLQSKGNLKRARWAHFELLRQNTSDALHLTRLGNQTNKYRKDHFIALILVALFFSNVSIPSISIQINGYSGV